MLTVLAMLESGPLMNGKSLLVRSSTTKMRMNGLQARTSSVTVSLMPSSERLARRQYSSGAWVPFWESAKAKVMTREHTAATTSVRAGPMKCAAAISGSAKERPATSVTGQAPLRARAPPPTSITMRMGQAMTNGKTCSAWVVESWMASMPVMEARVVVGMPMEPNMVGTPLAMRQARMAVTGWMPSATSMLAGMATAVPKPAMPSRKAPKHQAMSSVRTRLSLETEHSMCLMVSMAPVCTVRL